jgi:catechol 2,3-dioxygenase-like lactoylglutathione lyase family enzyme
MRKFKDPHLSITVNNIEETKTFYINIGFTLVDEIISPEKKRHFMLFEGYNFQIEVFHFDNQESQLAKTEDYMTVGFLHFALPTNDLKALKEKFVKQGLQLASDLRVTSLGVYNFTLIDPSGITVEFYQV